jgi:hypothetical protein
VASASAHGSVPTASEEALDARPLREAATSARPQAGADAHVWDVLNARAPSRQCSESQRGALTALDTTDELAARRGPAFSSASTTLPHLRDGRHHRGPRITPVNGTALPADAAGGEIPGAAASASALRWFDINAPGSAICARRIRHIPPDKPPPSCGCPAADRSPARLVGQIRIREGPARRGPVRPLDQPSIWRSSRTVFPIRSPALIPGTQPPRLRSMRSAVALRRPSTPLRRATSNKRMTFKTESTRTLSPRYRRWIGRLTGHLHNGGPLFHLDIKPANTRQTTTPRAS